MANFRLAWINLLDTGTLVAGAQETSLPIENLQNPHGAPSLAWQTPAGVVTNDAGAYFILDAGYTAEIDVFALARTNLSIAWTDGTVSDGARVCWRVWQHADMQDDSLAYSSGWLPANIVFRFGQHVHLPRDLNGTPTRVLGRYIRCDLFDPYNTDGCLNIPLAFIGPAWTPAINPAWSSTLGRAASVIKNTTRGGQNYVTLNWLSRQWSLNFTGITDDEVWSRVMDLDAACRHGGNVLIVPDPDDPNINRSSVLGLCEPSTPLGWASELIDARSWSTTVTERL